MLLVSSQLVPVQLDAPMEATHGLLEHLLQCTSPDDAGRMAQEFLTGSLRTPLRSDTDSQPTRFFDQRTEVLPPPQTADQQMAGGSPQFPAAVTTNRNRDVRGVCAVFKSRRLAREAVISSHVMLQQGSR